MSRRARLQYILTTIGYGASRMKARLPRSTCLLGDSLAFGASVRYGLPSHTTSRQNLSPRLPSLVSVRAIAFRSWLPPIGPIKDFHLQSLRHARRNSEFRCAQLSAAQPKVGKQHTRNYSNRTLITPGTKKRGSPVPTSGASCSTAIIRSCRSRLAESISPTDRRLFFERR